MREIIEICEMKPWLHKIRSLTNARKWYDVVQRRDESFWCSCNSFKYNKSECKHIQLLEAIL